MVFITNTCPPMSNSIEFSRELQAVSMVSQVLALISMPLQIDSPNNYLAVKSA